MQFLYIFTSNLHDIKLLHAYSYHHLFSKIECYSYRIQHMQTGIFFQFSQTITIVHKNPVFNIFSNRFNLHQKSVSGIKMLRNEHSLHSNCFESFIYIHACNKFIYCMLYNKNLDMQPEFSIQFHYQKKYSMQFLYIFTSNLHDIKLLDAYSYHHLFSKTCYSCRIQHMQTGNFFQFSQTITIVHKNPAFSIFSNRFNLHQKSVSDINMPRKCTLFAFKLF